MAHSDDEEEAFVRKIKTLKHVAIDLTDVLKAQNKSIKDLEPGLSGTFFRLRGHLARLHAMDPKRFRGWLCYLGASAVMVVFLLIFMFVI